MRPVKTEAVPPSRVELLSDSRGNTKGEGHFGNAYGNGLDELAEIWATLDADSRQSLLRFARGLE